METRELIALTSVGDQSFGEVSHSTDPRVCRPLRSAQQYPPTLHIVASGSASAVKEPGHFEVRKSSSQVTRMHFFLIKVDDLF